MQDSCQAHFVSCSEFSLTKVNALNREVKRRLLCWAGAYNGLVAWKGVRLTARRCGPFSVVRRKLGYSYWFEAVMLVVA
jgi:hypothetical protein